MKKVVILGNSFAALKAVGKIRAADAPFEIIHVPLEPELPYNRYLLADWVAQDIAREEIYYFKQEQYNKLQMRTMTHQKILRINFTKNYIVCEQDGQKERLDYDYLIIANAGDDKFPEIKGVNKSGVLNYKKFSDVDRLVQVLPFAETVVVQTSDILGMKIASALCRRGKEVVIVSAEDNPLKSFVEQESWAAIKSICEEKGMRFISENTIYEIFGEGDVKAVKLSSGKVFSCQAVFLGDMLHDLRIFKDSELDFNDRILVNNRFQTNLDNIFAVDSICNFNAAQQLDNYENYNGVLEQQGEVVASCILGQEISLEEGSNVSIGMPILKNSVELVGVFADFLGVPDSKGMLTAEPVAENAKISSEFEPKGIV